MFQLFKLEHSVFFTNILFFFLYIVTGKIMIVKPKQLNDLTRVYYVENHRSWKKSINERF